jgi:hypothetical protein
VPPALHIGTVQFASRRVGVALSGRQSECVTRYEYQQRERRGAVTSTSGKAITARQAAVEVLRRAGEPLKSAEIARPF